MKKKQFKNNRELGEEYRKIIGELYKQGPVLFRVAERVIKEQIGHSISFTTFKKHMQVLEDHKAPSKRVASLSEPSPESYSLEDLQNVLQLDKLIGRIGKRRFKILTGLALENHIID